MKNIILPLFFLLSIQISFAALSDLYQFNDTTPANITFVPEPEIKAATYEFIDENNNGLYDYLVVQPQGYIRIYDAYSDFVAASENNKIDLKQFYAKKAEGPYRIVVEFENDIYEATTGNESYLQFEHNLLPDLKVSLNTKSSANQSAIIVESADAAAFDFYVSVYEDSQLMLHKHIDYIKQNSEISIPYQFTKPAKVFVDFENNVEESNEENNFAEYNLTATNSLQTNNGIAGIVNKKRIGSGSSPDPFSADLLKKNKVNATQGTDENKKSFFDNVRDFFNGLFSREISAEQKDSNQENNRNPSQNLLTGNVVNENIEKPALWKGILIMLLTAAVGIYGYFGILKKGK